jgi:uncharacterized membrane protein
LTGPGRMLMVPEAARRRRSPWLVLLGLALGGFFDGILLHQILQWHHLLSLKPGGLSLRAQLLWDGYFHAAMYVVALVALWRIWAKRDAYDWRAGCAVPLVLIGFGCWHVLDAVLSHWILGIHRIRGDSPQPLLWDLLWLGVFGLLPLAVGLLWQRRTVGRGGRHLRRKSGAIAPMIGLAAVTVAAGSWASSPSDNQAGLTTVVFAPGIRPADAFNVIHRAGARIAWTTPDLAVAVIDLSAEKRSGFYLQGALLVSGTGPAAGCVNWATVPRTGPA